jgi:hypothetical protein
VEIDGVEPIEGSDLVFYIHAGRHVLLEKGTDSEAVESESFR